MNLERHGERSIENQAEKHKVAEHIYACGDRTTVHTAEIHLWREPVNHVQKPYAQKEADKETDADEPQSDRIHEALKQASAYHHWPGHDAMYHQANHDHEAANIQPCGDRVLTDKPALVNLGSERIQNKYSQPAKKGSKQREQGGSPDPEQYDFKKSRVGTHQYP